MWLPCTLNQGNERKGKASLLCSIYLLNLHYIRLIRSSTILFRTLPRAHEQNTHSHNLRVAFSYNTQKEEENNNEDEEVTKAVCIRQGQKKDTYTQLSKLQEASEWASVYGLGAVVALKGSQAHTLTPPHHLLFVERKRYHTKEGEPERRRW